MQKIQEESHIFVLLEDWYFEGKMDKLFYNFKLNRRIQKKTLSFKNLDKI